MGFFYSGDKGAVAKRTAKRAPMRPAAPSTKNAETLNRLGCRACPLDKADVCTPKMKPTFAKQSLVYFLDEFPTKYEDEQSGKPLTSDAGELLRECIPEGEERYCAFDNVVRDRPPGGREPTWQEVECCRSNITKSIEEAKPALIVGLGIIPLKAFLNSTDMLGMRGRLFAVKVGNHSCWFMPIYHPKFIIKHAFDQSKPLQSKLGHALRMDLRRAFKLLGKLQPPHIDTAAEVRANIEVFTGGPGQLQNLLARISEASKATIKAIDLETYPLRPYAADARLLTAALTWGTTNVAFALDHPKAGWSPAEKQQIKAALRPLLLDDTIKVAHNTPFELEWLVSYYKDMTIVRHEVWECTQMQAHFIDERRGREAGGDDDAQARRAVYQSLNFLCKQHFGVAYKSMFKLDKKDLRKGDLKEILIYNGADTKYTLRLYYHQLKLLKQNDVLEAYYEAILRQPTVALMQYIGAPIDEAANKAAAKRLMEGFDDDDGVHIDGIRETMEAINDLKVIKEYNRREHEEFNPLSAPDLLKVFRDYLKRPEIKATVERDREGRERTKFALDKAVLDTIDHPLAEYVLTLRNRTKLKSTYVDCFEAGKGAAIWPDGRIHTNFNTTFAETGRTSCVPWWTPIVTKRGTVPIVKVQVGDEVWTHKARWRHIKACWLKGVEQMYSVHLADGSVLTCTKNHRVLLATGEWQTIGEINDLLQEVDRLGDKSSGRIKAIPQQENAERETDSSTITNDRKQCVVGHPQLPECSGTKSVENCALLNVQIGCQKPNDWTHIRQKPALERCLRGWKGIPDNKDEAGTRISPYASYLSSIGVGAASSWLGNTPHRRKQTEQRLAQSCSGDQFRAQGNSPEDETGFEIVEIKKIEDSGSYEVFDITVDEDASYLACGVFSHNSDEPNQQNWPKRRDAWVRRQVATKKGHVFLAFDYGQLEGCTSAVCSGDKVMIKALWENYDFHMEWAHKLAGLYPEVVGGSYSAMKDKKVAKNLRGIAKNKLVFPAIFGAQDSSIHGYLVNATGVDIPEKVISKLMNEFWSTFSGLRNWQDKTMKRYYDEGFVVSPTGRKHWYPLTRNQAINFPIQSFGADIVCDAMCRLSEMAVRTGKWHLHPVLNIHDDLTFIIPDDNDVLEDAINTIYRAMLTVDYKCINVPLSVEASWGDNWFEMKDIGKFWSHRDL